MTFHPPLPLFLINRSRLVITNRKAAFDKALNVNPTQHLELRKVRE
jgi:hypothetical protein